MDEGLLQKVIGTIFNKSCRQTLIRITGQADNSQLFPAELLSDLQDETKTIQAWHIVVGDKQLYIRLAL